jgi:hypothetical protein
MKKANCFAVHCRRRVKRCELGSTNRKPRPESEKKIKDRPFSKQEGDSTAQGGCKASQVHNNKAPRGVLLFGDEESKLLCFRLEEKGEAM